MDLTHLRLFLFLILLFFKIYLFFFFKSPIAHLVDLSGKGMFPITASFPSDIFFFIAHVEENYQIQKSLLGERKKIDYAVSQNLYENYPL